MFHKWNKYGECPQGTIPIRRTPTNNSSIYHRKTPGSDGYDHEVQPRKYGDNAPRLFTFWTRDGHVDTGCYNMACSGFVVTNPTFSFGCAMAATSIYGGAQYGLKVEIERDHITESWWIHVNDIQIGCWPDEIFTTMSQGVEIIDWGGEIINEKTGGRHTLTHMGSGHFPQAGYRKVAFFGNIKIKDANNNWIDANRDLFRAHMDAPDCYPAEVGVPRMGLGSYFFYGGPGGTRCGLI